MRYSVTILFIAVAITSLGGCGQTGPLYMPPEEAPQAQPAAPTESAEQPTKDS